MIPMLAQTTLEVGTWFMVFIAVINGIAGAVGIIAMFATRREVEKLETRVDHLEKKLSDNTKHLHSRVTRILAVQSLIAGQVGVILEKEKIHDAINQLARDEEDEGENS